MSENNKSFEQALLELEKIVDALENGDVSLDDSIEMFQKGMQLSKYCSSRLDEFEKKITVLVENQNGELSEEEFRGAVGG
ncbi:MAG TPA: exodeoxyribonuclease VII small subunit [Clostridia bacterium]